MLFALMGIAAYLVPNVPSSVPIQLQRQEVLIRKIIKGTPDAEKRVFIPSNNVIIRLNPPTINRLTAVLSLFSCLPNNPRITEDEPKRMLINMIGIVIQSLILEFHLACCEYIHA
jgi:hypothetical protein